MSDSVLIFAEQQGGKITRPTWEALAAGQRMAEDIKGSATALVLGGQVAALAAELAAADLTEVAGLESPALAEYTPDGYAAALAEVIRTRQPRYVVFSHTYQVRDFTPKLAVALRRWLPGETFERIYFGIVMRRVAGVSRPATR